jgi:L-histidine N-alpha-methyltransferase
MATRAARLDVHLTPADAHVALRTDVLLGLTAHPKELPPKYFYDARGSALFEQITALPEYFPTRTEAALLAAHVDEIAARSGAATLVELGSGSSAKTRLLLDAFLSTGTLRRYVPQDVSETALRGALDALSIRYPALALHGVVGDFTRHLDRLPTTEGPGDRRLVAFLGGTIGNLVPAARAVFLGRLRAALAPDEQLLLGASLVTDPTVLVAAYDDPAGVTAAFNRNVLRVLNRELRADFDLDAFAHVALWDPEHEWIEMRLRARRAMAVTVRDLGLVVEFGAGEELHTEVSAKFRPAGLAAELRAAGFAPVRTWMDPQARFALTLAAAAEVPALVQAYEQA